MYSLLFAMTLVSGQIPDAPATILVSLPADARLFVDGAATRSTGSSRRFDTPALQSGTYTLRAEIIRNGQVIAEEQAVRVYGGQESYADFFQNAIRESSYADPGVVDESQYSNNSGGFAPSSLGGFAPSNPGGGAGGFMPGGGAGGFGGNNFTLPATPGGSSIALKVNPKTGVISDQYGNTYHRNSDGSFTDQNGNTYRRAPNGALVPVSSSAVASFAPGGFSLTTPGNPGGFSQPMPGIPNGFNLTTPGRPNGFTQTMPGRPSGFTQTMPGRPGMPSFGGGSAHGGVRRR
jgi:uncharacterized protein (TIGR03000 family)